MGIWSAGSVAILAAGYATTGAIGMAHRPPGSDLLSQIDPYLAILQSILLLVSPCLVVVMTVVYRYAQPDRKVCALIALALTIAFASIDTSAQFISLSFGRQAPGAADQLAWLVGLNNWPSIAMAADLLAWDFLLGLALLSASLVFEGAGFQYWARLGLTISGALCVLATLAPLLGRMELQYFGILGYAFLMPVACVLMAFTFARVEVPS